MLLACKIVIIPTVNLCQKDTKIPTKTISVSERSLPPPPNKTHMNFRIILSISVKEAIEFLIQIALNL